MRLIFFGSGYCSNFIIPLIGNNIEIICTHKNKIKTQAFDKNLQIKRILFDEFFHNFHQLLNTSSIILNSIPPINEKDILVEKLKEFIKNALESEKFKIYESADVKGVEYAGALKNIYAICCGIGDKLDVGENAIGLIITRSMTEMSKFAVHKGANPITFLGLAGMGDLVATCTSKLSRNFSLGRRLAKGDSLEEAKAAIGQVAEGVRTLQVVYEEANNNNLAMPLVNALHKIVFENANPNILMDDLIGHPDHLDVEFAGGIGNE